MDEILRSPLYKEIQKGFEEVQQNYISNLEKQNQLLEERNADLKRYAERADELIKRQNDLISELRLTIISLDPDFDTTLSQI